MQVGINTFKFPNLNIKHRGESFLKEEQLKILKIMNEATSRMDLTTFAQAVNLEPNQAVADIQELAKEGFLQRSGKGFCLTEKGKNIFKITEMVAAEKAFQFYLDVNKPLGFSAQSLEEFYRLMKQVCLDAVEFHLYRGDFENWIREVLTDSELAAEFGNLKTAELHGEELRKALLKAVDAKYGVGELL